MTPPDIIEFKDRSFNIYYKKTATEAEYSYNNWVCFHLDAEPSNKINKVKVEGRYFTVGDLIWEGTKWVKIENLVWSDADSRRIGWKAYHMYGWTWLGADCLAKISDNQMKQEKNLNEDPPLSAPTKEGIKIVSPPVSTSEKGCCGTPTQQEKTYTLTEVILLITSELKHYTLKAEADKNYLGLIETIKEKIELEKELLKLKYWPTDEEVEKQANNAGTNGYNEFKKAVKWLKELKGIIGADQQLISTTTIKVEAANKYPITLALPSSDKERLAQENGMQRDRRNAFELGADWALKQIQK